MYTNFAFSYFIHQDSIHLPDDVLRLGTKNTLTAGSQLVSIGDELKYIYYIQEGELSLNAISSDGKERKCMVVKKNMFYGEAHLYNNIPVMFRVVATMPTTYIMFSLSAARKLIETSQEFRMILINAQSQKIFSMTGEIVSLMIHSPEERVLHYLLDKARHVPPENGCISLHLSQQDIAHALGMHRVTVATALSSLSRAGHIACARNSITMLQPG